MRYLLNVIYVGLLVLASPWLIYAAIRKGKYRRGFAEKLLGNVPRRQADRPCVWLHGVSVGEINLLEPLVKMLAETRPDIEIVISTTTQTGHELASRKYAGRTLFFCPLDFSWSVERALDRIRPDMVVLAELELWPNLIAAAKRRGIRTAIVNGRLSERSARGYARIKWLIASVLRQVDHIAAQNDEYADRFLSLGASPEAVTVTGSMKFDGAETDRDNPASNRLRHLWHVTADTSVLLAGSTQAPEEQMLVECFAKLVPRHPNLRLVLVPRHPDRFAEVAELLDRSGLAWQRRTTLTADSNIAPASVLLVDTVGELRAWWGLASVGFVGGSFGTRGGQSMIEPAAYGVPVCFGPNTRNFREIVEMLLSKHGAKVVRDQYELHDFVKRCLSDADYSQVISANAKELVRSQLGATRRTLALLENSLPPKWEVRGKCGVRNAKYEI